MAEYASEYFKAYEGTEVTIKKIHDFSQEYGWTVYELSDGKKVFSDNFGSAYLEGNGNFRSIRYDNDGVKGWYYASNGRPVRFGEEV